MSQHRKSDEENQDSPEYFKSAESPLADSSSPENETITSHEADATHDKDELPALSKTGEASEDTDLSDYPATSNDEVSEELAPSDDSDYGYLELAGSAGYDDEETIDSASELNTNAIPVIEESFSDDNTETESNLDSTEVIQATKRDRSSRSKPVDEELNLQEIFSKAPETSNKKKKKTGLKIGVTIGSLAIIAAAALGYFYISDKDNTIVPSAASSLTVGSELSAACTNFIEASLSCEVTQTPNDLIKRGDLIKQSVASSEKVKKDTKIVLSYSSGPSNSEFPNLKNKAVAEAEKALYDMNIKVKEIKEVDGEGLEKDMVVSTSIEPGSEVENGSEVVLNVSSGKIKVPDWKAKTRELVEAEAKELGVEIEFKEEESEQVSGVVISQTPAAGEVASASKVQVTISKAFETKDIKVPDVIGKKASEAQLELATEGFRHIKTVTVKNSEVTETQVTQVVPGVGQTGKSEENIVIIVSEPDK